MTKHSHLSMDRGEKGQGEGDNYEPGIRIQQIPSKGICVRTPGWHSNRMHHLLSLLEYMFFLMFECRQYVYDIREQWRLHQGTTIEIAKRLGIRHPVIPYSSKLAKMTTDLFITYKKGNQIWYEAYAIKPKSLLGDRRTMEKLLLEREYWKHLNIFWALLTQEQLDKTLVQNMKLIHNRRSAKHIGICPEEFEKIREILTYLVQQDHLNLRDITKQCATELGVPQGRCMKVALHLIAVGQWRVNLMKPISPFQPIKLIQE